MKNDFSSSGQAIPKATTENRSDEYQNKKPWDPFASTQAGYSARLPVFCKTGEKEMLERLRTFVPDASGSQVKAWKDSLSILKVAANQLLRDCPHTDENSSIVLEYVIPMESRRIDAVLLLNGIVVVLEFKGKPKPLQADTDQAAAYARDLRAYHKECSVVPVKCVLILNHEFRQSAAAGDVSIMGPDRLAEFCRDSMRETRPAPDLAEFLSMDSYYPLPSLIKAARELFSSGSLTRIHRAAIATEPTINVCTDIIHHTARNRRRALILISGVPGAGKTLVGLQLAHAKYLDDLAVARENGEVPTAPSVFLSGNGPLVEVLQYELRSAGGDGKAFVRGVHEYVKTFSRPSNPIPPQHVLIYDEAQRAFDADQVAAKHPTMPSIFRGLSEPELFVQFAERIPDWCVVIGLIGSGQEIHIGEEAGIGQWAAAIEGASEPDIWDIYVPDSEEIRGHFVNMKQTQSRAELELSITIRFHLATRLYDFVKCLLNNEPVDAKLISQELEANGYNLRITQNLDRAKAYLHNRYADNSDARFGIIASARDRDLRKCGIPKGFKSPYEVGPGKYGKWYSEQKGISGSCTELHTVATEFGTQGLELDACLLAWGTDFIRDDGVWSDRLAARYQNGYRIKNAKALRENAYRVLLTRGRDGCVVFMPELNETQETYVYLKECGFTELED